MSEIELLQEILKVLITIHWSLIIGFGVIIGAGIGILLAR